MHQGGRRVRSRAFGPFPCAWGVNGFVRSIPARPWCRWVGSVHCRAPCVSSGSLVCVQSIHVRHGCRRFRRFAFSPFPCAMWVVGFVGARSVHSRAPRESSGSFVCVRSIPVRPGSRRVCTVHSRAQLVSLDGFGPFPFALGVVGFVGVRSVHSRAPWVVGLVGVHSVHSPAPRELSGSFVCVRSILVRPGVRSVLWSLPVRSRGRRVPSCAFGKFPYALAFVRFVRMVFAHFRAPCGS